MPRSLATDVRGEVQELRLLFEISQILDSNADVRDVLSPVLKAMAENMGMVRGTITLLDRGRSEIVIEAAYGLSASQQRRGRYRPGEGVTGRVVQTGRPMVVPSISNEPQFLDRTGSRSQMPKEEIAFLCVPIKHGPEVIGALSADRLFDSSVSLEEDARLMSVIASMIAQNVQLRRAALEERRALEEENIRLQTELKDRFRPDNLVGNSAELQAVFDLVEQVSETNTTVLIRGESGTGKELIAHAIHYHSPRASKPYIKVNCAALPENVIESELFGHEKGAFTSAIQMRKGRFELASAAPSSSTKSAISRPPPRSSFCASCRNASSSVSAAPRRFRPTCA